MERRWYNDVARAYFNANPQYLSLLTGPGLQNNNETIAQRLQDIETALSLAETLSGKADARQAQYSANLVTGYDVTAERFKGLSVGGTYRWRGKPILGYGYVPGRTDLFDTSNVFYGEAIHMAGLFIGYKFKLPALKVSGKLQLNVDGLTSDEDLHPYSAVDAGNGKPLYYRYSVGPGRTYALTASFSY